MILLDTHIWLWWLLGDGSLKNRERDALDELAAGGSVSISWVTLWETELLERKGRIKLLPDFSEWIRTAVGPGNCKVLPVDMEVVLAQRNLPESFPNDPADRLIVATAMLTGYPIATHDRHIRSSVTERIWEP